MASTPDPWFVMERSEALAKILFTSRNDVHIRSERRTDVGIELLVEVGHKGNPSTRFMMAQVKGTMSSQQAD